VVLVSSGTTSAAALLETLASRGYEGPFVLLAAGLTRVLRQRALVQGALDVITLPADSGAIQARVQAAAQQRWSHSAPLAP
jgi:FixJ family two-component response regulator